MLLLALLQAAVVAGAPVRAPVAGGSSYDLAYGPLPHERLDLHYATHTGIPQRCIVFLHSGGFVGGDKAIDPALPVFRTLLERGICIASANYGLSPSYVFPVQPKECGRALQWIRANADALRIDPERIGVMGRSSGATLALWVAYGPELQDLGSSDPVLHESSRPKLLVNYSGTTDLTALALSADGAYFGKPTLATVPFASLQKSSALYWLPLLPGPKPPACSTYGGQPSLPPIADVHDAAFGFWLHDALTQSWGTESLLLWDPAGGTPDYAAVANWVAARL